MKQNNETINLITVRLLNMVRAISLLLIILTSFCFRALAQGVAIGQWRDHLQYNDGQGVAIGKDAIYCSTGSGLFSYYTSDNSLQKFSKINGLSEVGKNTIGYNEQTATLVIGYFNGNIDLLIQGNIINVGDIKRSTIIGNKEINSIYFIEDIAYLACGFGIVVLDLSKKEMKETYHIGANGSFVNILEITSDGSELVAATDEGIYKASLSAPNLADFNSWQKLTQPAPGAYNTITFFNNRFYTNKKGLGIEADTVFVYDKTSWTSLNIGNLSVSKIRASEGKLVVSRFNTVESYDTSITLIKSANAYFKEWNRYPRPEDAIYDANGTLWIADSESGLVKTADNATFELLLPNSPLTKNIRSITISNNEVWTAPGGVNGVRDNLYRQAEIAHFSNEEWETLYHRNVLELGGIVDIMNVVVNPASPGEIWASVWNYGLINIKEKTLTAFKDTSIIKPAAGLIRAAGLAYDTEGNLWVTNADAEEALSVKKTDGTWKSFKIAGNGDVGDLIITKNGYKWMRSLRGNGIVVFTDNNTIDDTSDDKSAQLTTSDSLGALPAIEVYAIAEDKKGQVWIGTGKGIAVIAQPENIFNGGDYAAQPIKLTQDGVVQFLLETEIVTAIAVDGANRKWIGTSSAGVFLMSEDGTQEIHAFNADNSPLVSNSITSIAIHPKTGEVFIGTDKGLVSYKGTATEGSENFSTVYAYPNPVKAEYSGPIAITGLLENADVKITDVSGQVVFSTKALGGQAVWNGLTNKGERPKTGVYLVFSSNNDGSKTNVTKILFLN